MSESTAQADSLAGLTGREYALARRAMLSKAGKKGAAMLTPQSVAASRRTAPAATRAAEAMPTPAATEATTTTEAPIQDAAETAIDMACALVEGAPAVAEALAEVAGDNVRDYCRERRRALSLFGKSALPAKPGSMAGGSGGQSAARQRRLEKSLKGRGDAPASRPSGRVRPAAEAPAKVETGTTLSGQTVTGAQVERTIKVTGNEPGSCRAITGTEYIGVEQFDSFCPSRPAPAPAKVGASATSRGLTVSGPEVGRSAKVTGGETGTCKPVTGTEYLGSENFDEFCAGKGRTSRPEKVVMGATARKGLAVSGSDEARPAAVTGGEAGAKRGITGSQYNDAGISRLTINGPAKVALTHTIAGRPVSGVEIGRSVKVSGDEAGSCRAISGTEYLSNEQFQSICNTRPEAGPEKVGEAASDGGQRITGNLVERTGRITGNEPRAEGRVTGSQYEQGSTRESSARAERRPASVMSAAGSPKSSGDEPGRRGRVTGADYAGAALSAAGRGAPESMINVAKVDVSHTLRGQPVSGSPLGRSNRVTGDEPGSHLSISGTPYAASEQIAGACDCQHAEASEPAALPQAHPRFQPAGRPRAMAMSMVPAEPRPESFSVSAPAGEARGRITGTGYGGTGRITGPVNMASGLVSGTPEFRYRDEGIQFGGLRSAMPESAAPIVQVERITGEGREAGRRITGNDWGRSDRVTGTEGRWAQGRNPTQRGAGRGMDVGARANKGMERPEAPLAKVTGSSGNAGKGALITVSGGARG